jgi:TctA family transporter
MIANISLLLVLAYTHPHVQKILRVPILPSLWVERLHQPVILVIIFDGIFTVKDRILSILVETHFSLLYM